MNGVKLIVKFFFCKNKSVNFLLYIFPIKFAAVHSVQCVEAVCYFTLTLQCTVHFYVLYTQINQISTDDNSSYSKLGFLNFRNKMQFKSVVSLFC